MKIMTRADWGFGEVCPGWSGKSPQLVDPRDRREFFIHYQGGSHTSDTGASAMRSIHRSHLARGWKGIGYNLVVMQDGSVWEGRGWNTIGAHCPFHNLIGYGVQIHIGGDQRPTDAALRTARALYDEACERSGRSLRKLGHKDGYATDCPGVPLYSWVRAGMPAPGVPTPRPVPVPVPVQRIGDDGMAQIYVREAEHGHVFKVIETADGPRSVYVPDPKILAEDLRDDVTVTFVEYDTESALRTEFPPSLARRTVS